MNENIKVAIRVKPILNGDNPAVNYVIAPNAETNEICYMNKESRTQKLFSYDYVADSDLGQAAFFDKIQMKEKITQLLDGYNSTVFAYGPTGSGKTYTIQGKPMDNQRTPQTSVDLDNDENLGLIPRALAYLFSHIRKLRLKDQRVYYKINLEFLQIYNERIYDLLGINANQEHKVRWREGDQFIVENIRTINSLSAQDAIFTYESGMKNLVFATTKFNLASSRSHSMFFIIVDAYNAENDSK